MKYKDLISDQSVNKDFAVEGSSIVLQKSILDCKIKLDKANAELNNRKSYLGFKPEDIYAQYKQIKLIEKELEYYQELQKELF